MEEREKERESDWRKIEVFTRKGDNKGCTGNKETGGKK